jgi:Putative transposase
MIVPGGGLSMDGKSWVSCRPGFFLPAKVLSRLFRRLFLQKLSAAHKAGQLRFFGKHAALTERKAFATYLAPLHQIDWYVDLRRPFAGPEAVLAYLSRYTHRVAISNSRLIAANENHVSFKYKDYRFEGPDRYKVMTLAIDEFIRRFLMHVLPDGFHRIRHYGLFAKSVRADNIARMRALLDPAVQYQADDARADNDNTAQACPHCGGHMLVIETFERGQTPRHRPSGPMVAIRIDTS